MKKLTKEEIAKFLQDHTKYLNGEEDSHANLSHSDLRHANLSHSDLSCADLSGADLRCADLSCADLSGADLSHANLSHSDLSCADLDFSCWPLWCGSLGVKVDKKIAVQLLYHFCAVNCDDADVIAAQKAMYKLANEMHRNDVPRLS